MRSVPIELRVAERARCLAELSGALTEPQQLLFELDPVLHSDACELYQRIEAARMEVRLLQLSRSKAPKRTEFGAHDEGAISNSHRKVAAAAEWLEERREGGRLPS